MWQFVALYIFCIWLVRFILKMLLKRFTKKCELSSVGFRLKFSRYRGSAANSAFSILMICKRKEIWKIPQLLILHYADCWKLWKKRRKKEKKRPPFSYCVQRNWLELDSCPLSDHQKKISESFFLIKAPQVFPSFRVEGSRDLEEENCWKSWTTIHSHKLLVPTLVRRGPAAHVQRWLTTYCAKNTAI